MLRGISALIDTPFEICADEDAVCSLLPERWAAVLVAQDSPDSGFFERLARICARAEDVPVIALLSVDWDGASAKKAGATVCILKPITSRLPVNALIEAHSVIGPR